MVLLWFLRVDTASLKFSGIPRSCFSPHITIMHQCKWEVKYCVSSLVVEQLLGKTVPKHPQSPKSARHHICAVPLPWPRPLSRCGARDLSKDLAEPNLLPQMTWSGKDFPPPKWSC